MEEDKIEAYVYCREYIDYFQNVKMELMLGKKTLKTDIPRVISQTLQYYSGIEELKDEINYDDCINYIKIFEESKVKINKSMVKQWLEDNDKTINDLTAILESYEEHMRFFYESYGYLESHRKTIASDLDEEFSDYEKYLLKYYGDVEKQLYDLEFIDPYYRKHIKKIEDVLDLKNINILGETNWFKKHIKILECGDISYIQASITVIARRNHHIGSLGYNWGDALTYIKAIERLRELVDRYLD